MTKKAQVVDGVQSLAAAGADQANAAQIVSGFVVVTGADDAKGVKLPVGKAGTRVTVVNTVSNKALLVYPNTGAKVNGGAANAAFTQTTGKNAIYEAKDGTDWYAVVSA